VKDTQKLHLILSMICLLLSITYLYCNTPLFFTKIKSQSIQVFFSTSQATYILLGENLGGVLQKYDGIKSVNFAIKNPIGIGYDDEIQIHYNNFTQEEDFWFDIGNGTEEYNELETNQYVLTHQPDYLIRSSFIKNGTIPIWSQVWYSRINTIPTNNFFYETSFGVWEGEYFFDNGFSGTHAYDDYYLKAKVEQIIFKIVIPNGYYLEKAELYKLEIYHNATILTEILTVGDSFHITLKNKQTEVITSVVSFIPLILGTLLGFTVKLIWDGFLSKKKSRKRK